MTTPLILIAAAYLLGSTPTSWVVGRLFFGVDLRKRGSGNLGATNAVRILGWRAGIPSGLFDVFKGWLPVFLFPRLDGTGVWEWTLAYAAAAIIGHVFSFWLRFRGGKGVATSAGAFLALAPTAFLLGAAVWLTLAFSVKIVSVASLGAAVALPVAVWLTAAEGRTSLLVFTTGLAAFVVWAHRENIGRLLRGEEPLFRPAGSGWGGGDGSRTGSGATPARGEEREDAS